ncbi:hypothetical protein B0I37DRAFT_237141 [Chaetomium sp. MPI-CAGE-AT-0009]|nr:hypothetical protein B0I37DRAFT_237141 [Chaetomium sp. MPI-CAGE-AT-0009]
MEDPHEPPLGPGAVGKSAPPPPPPPPPPPLPSLSRNPPTHKAVTVPERPTEHAGPPSDNIDPHPFEPVYYFFYGTLRKPNILQGVLGLDSEPTLRPAKIHDYELANWGQYRTLVDGDPGAVVNGYACRVQSAEGEYKLAYYETNAYALASCKIHFTDGGDHSGPVDGKTFKYAGDAAALKEGRFDRVLWERQMGQPLPPRRQEVE